MCFLDFSFRNTFCVSMGKTLWKSQNVSLNGFFWGKHHPAPAVLCTLDLPIILWFHTMAPPFLPCLLFNIDFTIHDMKVLLYDQQSWFKTSSSLFLHLLAPGFHHFSPPPSLSHTILTLLAFSSMLVCSLN